eukprot:gi/632960291/ref/XP_007896108.1/ PREDICTED: tumor necrosis factor receptor superfamily member 25 [Callorhinchus milii]
MMCLTGYYWVASCDQPGGPAQCKPCLSETYIAHPNYEKKCRRCRSCDSEHQVIKNCTSTNDTVCGCPKGKYQNCDHERCQNFRCLSCTSCLQRQVTITCSDRADTSCGDCLPGYQMNSDQQQCVIATSPPEDPEVPKENLGLKVWVPAGLLPVIVFLVLLVVCSQRQRVPQEPFTIPVMEEGDCKGIEKQMFVDLNQKPEFPTNNNNYNSQSPPQELDSKAGLCPGLAEGRALYEIINVVPVRRWKEFVRLLELKDCDIERVQMDVLLFRDQQYEMLRCWGQQANASLQLVFNTLEGMGLAGCAQQLQGQLQHQPGLLP